MRQHAVSVRATGLTQPSLGAGSRAGAGAGVVVPALRGGACCWPSLQGGEITRVSERRRGASRGGLARARCMTRGQGWCSRTVAMSQAPEDRASTPRWRVLTQIVLSRRGRRVSRFGKNHVKSTTWTPSTLHIVVWSRPTRRPRSARTSSPRTSPGSYGVRVGGGKFTRPPSPKFLPSDGTTGPGRARHGRRDALAKRTPGRARRAGIVVEHSRCRESAAARR